MDWMEFIVEDGKQVHEDCSRLVLVGSSFTSLFNQCDGVYHFVYLFLCCAKHFSLIQCYVGLLILFLSFPSYLDKICIQL